MLKAKYWKKVLLIVLLVSIVSNLAGAETFRFTVSADNRPGQGNIPRWEWLLDEMSDKVGDEGVFHIMPGDFDDPAYTDATLIAQFGEDVVWYPAVGNHETETSADMAWVRNAYYSLPYIVNEGPAGCETTTFSWDYGNAHFVALNQYYNGVSDTGAGGDVIDVLYDWLVADLEANTLPFVFVIGHEPAYPEYRHVGDSLDQHPANRDRFWKLLNDEQVVAYFCGHTHTYYAKQVDGPDWEPFTWQVDCGNSGNGSPNTFVDVTVTETVVMFNTWQGTQNSPFTIIESWIVGIPNKAYRPDPADGAVHHETWATLSWTAGAGAASHDVYFSENFDDVNDGIGGTFGGNQAEVSFAVGSPESAYPQSFVPGVTYYWRVDEVNELDPNSPWKGDVWSFTTAPGNATEPDPANNAVGMAIDATLSWWPGLTAATRDVYFGTSSPPALIGNQTEPNFNPGPLELSTTYYWQVDEVEADGMTIYTGDIWSFTTVPAEATQPDPANDGLVVTLDATLSWLPGPTAATHDVYFGTSSPPPFIGNQAESSFDPGPLEFGTTYYWQVDEIEADGTTVHTGDIWSFTPLFDVTAPGDTVQGVPNDGDWPGPESPPMAIDDNIGTKYLHLKGDEGPSGFRVTVAASARQSIVTALTFTTANDYAGRDPVAFEFSGSNESIDGPYTLIASGDIVDFAQAAAWPRFTKNATPISFDNEAAYAHYEVLFTAIRGGSGQWINSMQIAEVELLGLTRNAGVLSPADGATNVPKTPTLRWAPGATAASHDVYFSADQEAVIDGTAFIGNQAETSYSPPGLVKGTAYYWRVDEVEADGTTKHTGDVWSFMTVPDYATQPYPANNAVSVGIDGTLSWLPGFTAATHDVYFGTSSPPAFIGNQETATYYPGPLEPSTTYYWQVDEIEADGTTIYTGDIWSFKTYRPGTGTILYELWVDLGFGSAVSDLTGNENYPHNPMYSLEVMPFEALTDLFDSFGGRLHGYLHPETSGDYLFWIASDDNGELWLSTDKSPSNAVLISTASFTEPRQFDNPNVTPSGPIPLVGGEKYYIMALYKEGWGSDNCAVAWEGPDSPTRAVIAGYFLSPYVELKATRPDPVVGTTEVKRRPTLSWLAGGNTASVNGHELYLSSDVNAVNDRIAEKIVLSEASYSITTKLDTGKTYYWCVDEIEADGITRHIGDVWSFTVTTISGR